jgi:hypothetical protein
MIISPYFIGGIALIISWLLYFAFTGTLNIALLFEGVDGRSSTSKFQFFVWTATIIYFYIVFYFARGVVGVIPDNLLITMGFSITTMAASKGITSGFVSNGLILKNINKKTGIRGLALDDDDVPDLSKIQMLIWTVIAIVVYTLNFIKTLNTSNGLPDIDGTLMTLMGLGQGGYLVKKFATSDKIMISGLSLDTGTSNVTISGQSFDDIQNGSFITFDGNPLNTVTIVNWSDSKVTFTLPSKQVNGTSWASGQKIMIGITVGGIKSNELPFTII